MILLRWRGYIWRWDDDCKWPSIKEWWNISGRIRKAHGFVNCIGLIDGTLFPLAFAPMANGEDSGLMK